jgi:hypothetical protein
VPGAGAAATDAAELTSQPVDLKSGVPYRFTLDVGNLGGGEARLLILGETLPKDAISQLTPYARSSVDRTGAAAVLLAKTLQYIETVPLDERELRYLASHAGDFDGLSVRPRTLSLTLTPSGEDSGVKCTQQLAKSQPILQFL